MPWWPHDMILLSFNIYSICQGASPFVNIYIQGPNLKRTWVKCMYSTVQGFKALSYCSLPTSKQYSTVPECVNKINWLKCNSWRRFSFFRVCNFVTGIYTLITVHRTEVLVSVKILDQCPKYMSSVLIEKQSLQKSECLNHTHFKFASSSIHNSYTVSW